MAGSEARRPARTHTNPLRSNGSVAVAASVVSVAGAADGVARSCSCTRRCGWRISNAARARARSAFAAVGDGGALAAIETPSRAALEGDEARDDEAETAADWLCSCSTADVEIPASASAGGDDVASKHLSSIVLGSCVVARGSGGVSLLEEEDDGDDDDESDAANPGAGDG